MRLSLASTFAACLIALPALAQYPGHPTTTPQISAILLRVSASGVNATIGTSGRYRDTSRAVNPLCVKTAINFICNSRDA